MLKTLDLNTVQKMSPCKDAITWAKTVFGETIDKTYSCKYVIEMLMINKKYEWANWLIVRCMDRPQYLTYAIFAVEQVLNLFESKYPADKRPQKAIKSTKNCLKNDTKKNRKLAAQAAGAAAGAAAWAVTGAAQAAGTAAAAAWAAANAAGTEVDAAAAAAWAAGAAWATVDVAGAEVDAAAAAKQKMQIKILEYGMDLLNEK